MDAPRPIALETPGGQTSPAPLAGLQTEKACRQKAVKCVLYLSTKL
jgi:hypothetical protein